MADQNLKSFYLPLEGVDSDHCALIVEKGLSKIPEINNVKVETNNQRAIINSNGQFETILKSFEVVQDLGYKVPTLKVNIPVLQMTCASCAVSVESILKTSDGVINAEVNFANSMLKVEYIPGITSPEKMQTLIRSIGYDLMIETGADAESGLEKLKEDHLKKLKIKTRGSVILSIPVVIIGMFFMDMPYGNYIMWTLSTPVILFFGKDFFKNAWKQAKHKSSNMDTLVALSTGVAYLFSTFNTFLPHFWHERGLHSHVYFEAAVVVIAFILLGKLLEEKAKGNTSSAIKKLMGLQVKTVNKVINGETVSTDINQILKEDILLVKPGEKIAVDGKITKGSTFIDESTMTGESIPVMKSEGDLVFAGTINQKGSFFYKVEKLPGETLLAQIIKMVQDAQGSKAPVQKLVDKIASVFVPVVIVIAIITLISWIFLGGENGLTQGLMSMVTVLVIACPCALGLATPTAIMVGVGKGAESGILIKDAESLELSKKITAVVLDKTGTITEGKPSVEDDFWLEKEEKIKFISILKGIEIKSEHPLADAIVNQFQDIVAVEPEYFESITGKGVKAQLNANTYWVGNKKLIQENGIVIPELALKFERFNSDFPYTWVWFAENQKLIAIIAIADKIKEGSINAIKTLKSMGIEVHMLTGDNHNTALKVANQVAIENVKAEVLPQDKANYIKELQLKGHIVAMVGDGINDSTSLATADVSIAMGKGSDIAMDVAKMTIISSDLNKIPQAIQLSKQTVKSIKQNLFWAFIYNIIGIPIAAGLLFPINGFLLNPMIAGAAMAMSSLSVLGNSLRMKWVK